MNLTDEVKTILRIQDEGHDMYLSVMVPILEQHVIDHCNNQFTKDSHGEVVYPGPVKLFIAKACEFNMGATGLKGRSMGSVSYTYDLEFPGTLYQYLRPYKKVKFRAFR
jgi:hypothetical protein